MKKRRKIKYAIVFLMCVFAMFVCGCENSIEENSLKSSELSSKNASEDVDLQKLFLQEFPNAKIKESIYADIDNDNKEDFVALFSRNGKASSVGVAFSNKTCAAVDVAAGKNDDMVFITSNSLFIEEGSVGFVLKKASNEVDMYEFKVKFIYLGNGYNATVSSKKLKEEN